MPRFHSSALALALGALALLSAGATLATQAILSIDLGHNSLGQAASIVSAVLEGILFISVLYLWAPMFISSLQEPSRFNQATAFGLGVLISTIATATSVIGLVYARTVAVEKTSLRFVTACAVIVVLSLLSQVSFLIVCLLTARTEASCASWTFNKDEERSLTSQSANIKAIRYSQTFPVMSQSQRSTMYTEPLASPMTPSCRSTMDTARGSFSSMSQLTRPTSSVCRLLPSREVERGVSMDSSANRSSGGEAFDSWDTSAVDVHNRQAVLEISSPTQGNKSRCLETIPASPTPSRSPSPISLSGLEPPQVRSPRRSFSPVSIDRERLPRPTTPGASSEAHIHPLFRSDSPDPPPLASPGTSVVAAPDAGRVIMHRASNRSLNRMRSGSLPMTRSPLSRQGSFEDGRSLRHQQQYESDSMTVDETEARPQTGRTMTTPAGEWFLGGSLSSR